MNRNGGHKSKVQPLTQAALMAARLQIIEDGYSGLVSLSPRYISSEDYTTLAQQVADDFDVKIETHTDRQSGVAAIRLNRGFPLNIHPYSNHAKEWLAQDPSRQVDNQNWHNVFYGLHIVGD